jgi:hypothetical protein
VKGRPNGRFNAALSFGQSLRGGVFFVPFGAADGAAIAVEYLKHG